MAHGHAVAHILTLAQYSLSRRLSRLPPDADILSSHGLGNYKPTIDNWYRLSALGSLFLQEESKCHEPYQVVVISRFDSISFEMPVPVPTSLFSQDFGDHVLVQEPSEGSVYFENGLDLVLGSRAPMLDLALNLVWSFGSLVWDTQLPAHWREETDNPDTWRRFSGIQEAQWSLFLHAHAERFKVGFFGRIIGCAHQLTPFAGQMLLIRPSHSLRGFTTFDLEEIPKLYASGFCARPCERAALSLNTSSIARPHRIVVKEPVLVDVERSPTYSTGQAYLRRWYVPYYFLGTCLRRHVLLLCGDVTSRPHATVCLNRYLRGDSQILQHTALGLRIDDAQQLPAHYVPEVYCCESATTAPEIETRIHSGVHVEMPEDLEKYVSLVILSGGASIDEVEQMWMISDSVSFRQHLW
mmetsp:Transcript_53438/g.86528  ORF Transcript_53438/g.86528 Transcript_53438/m.86528 type:complete len:411 (-) Transcript_53438:50-1282(-)